MLVNEEYINQQIVNLKRQHEQHMANINAVTGALQVYEQLLAYLKLSPSEEQPPHEGN